MVVKRPDLEGIMQLRSGLRFVIVFLGGVLLDGAIFGSAQLLNGRLVRRVLLAANHFPSFEMIEDARAVYVQIRQAQKRDLETN
jgi:hypothetical protein